MRGHPPARRASQSRRRVASATATTSAPLAAQLRGDRQQERPGARQQHALAGEHALALGERLRAARGHHARERPAGEGDRAVVRAGGEHDRARPDRAAAGRRSAAAHPASGEAHTEAPASSVRVRGGERGAQLACAAAARSEARPHPPRRSAAARSARRARRTRRSGRRRRRRVRRPRRQTSPPARRRRRRTSTCLQAHACERTAASARHVPPGVES